jgi:hypothetical protein
MSAFLFCEISYLSINLMTHLEEGNLNFDKVLCHYPGSRQLHLFTNSVAGTNIIL